MPVNLDLVYLINVTCTAYEQLVKWNLNRLDEQSRQAILTQKTNAVFLNRVAQLSKDAIHRLTCLMDVRLNLALSTFACDCPKPCSEYTYYVTTFGSPWPHRSYQLAFYDEYTAPHSEIYGNKFDVGDRTTFGRHETDAEEFRSRLRPLRRQMKHRVGGKSVDDRRHADVRRRRNVESLDVNLDNICN